MASRVTASLNVGVGVTQKQQYQKVWIDNDNKLVTNETDNKFKKCLVALTCVASRDLTAALVLDTRARTHTHTTRALCTVHTGQSVMPITLPETSQLDSPMCCELWCAYGT